MISAEFCRQCGAQFPPKYGEGTCVYWWYCWLRWTTALIKVGSAHGLWIDSNDTYSLYDVGTGEHVGWQPAPKGQQCESARQYAISKSRIQPTIGAS